MSNRDYITVVSGLPRSGTSVMMQALSAGGLEPVVDGLRQPDDDNPRGYLELEAVKQIAKDASFLEGAEGRVLKLVHALVTRLPATHRYRVVFMLRPMEEVLASQAKMLQRAGKPGGALPAEQMARVLSKQRDDALAWLKQQANVSVLEVNYPALVADPAGVCGEVSRFLGELDERAMASAVDPGLYRNRVTPREEADAQVLPTNQPV